MPSTPRLQLAYTVRVEIKERVERITREPHSVGPRTERTAYIKLVASEIVAFGAV